MSFVFDEKKATNSLGETSWASGNRTGYLENFRASYDSAFSSDRFDSEKNSFEKEYSLMIDHLHKKGYTGFNNPINDNEDVPLGPEDPRILDVPLASDAENVENIWNKFKELPPEVQDEMTSLGYGSQDQLLKTMGTRLQGLHQKQADISDRSTGFGFVGSLAGTFSSLVLDPLVMASLPIGAMYSVPKTVLGAAWRVAWVEGLVATAVEIPIQIKAQGFRKDVGLPTEIEIFGKTIPLGVLNTLTVGAGSFVLGGLLQGVIKGTPKAVGTLRKALNKSSDAEIDKISKALEVENPEELSKVIEPENPFEDSIAINKIDTENHNAAQSQVLNDVKKEIKPIDAPLTKKSLDELKSNAVVLKAEEIEFDPVNFQYKTDTDASGVSNKLKNVTEWDSPSAGLIVVYEFAPKIDYKTGDVVTISSKGEKATIKKNFFINKEGSKNVDDLNKFIITTADGKTGTITLSKLKEFNKGKKAVVDGHQRLGLAKRLSAQGKKVELLATILREVDNISPEEAMIKGLMINLRQNTGTAIDAAKIMRSKFGADWSNFEKSLAARSNLVKNTQGLTSLSDDAWGIVINNKNLENLGSRVGAIIEDKSLHASIIKVLKDKKFTSLGELEQTLRLTNTLPKNVTKQDTLFGEEIFAETLLLERSQLLGWAKKNINKASAAFKTIIENDTTLQKAGNKLNKLNNEEQKIIYEQVQQRFEQVAIQAGSELSDKLTKAAQLLKEGKRGDAEKFFQQAIDDAAAKGDFRGSIVSRSSGVNKTEIETQTISPKFKEDLETNKLFDDPAKGYASEDASLTDIVLGEGISKSINDEVGSGGSVSTSPAVKSLSITQDLAEGSQRTKATPPSTVFADATASPPSLRGFDNIVVGSKSSITDRIIYHSTNDINELIQLAKKNYDGYLSFLNKFKEKHKANIKISIKNEKKLAKKLQTTKIEEVSDLLKARIDVDDIDAARAIAQDIKNTTKTIEFDDFLKTENVRGDGYRGIHMQLLTKDGMSVELQVRLKSMEEVLTRFEKLNKMKASDFKTARGLAAFDLAKDSIKKELDDSWLQALKKQGLGSDELIDQPIHTGTILNEAGEEIDIIKPVREFLEEDTKAAQALERLKDCK